MESRGLQEAERGGETGTGKENDWGTKEGRLGDELKVAG